MTRILIALALAAAAACFLAPAAASTEPAFHVAAGANGAWLDGPGAAWPADLEGGCKAWSSLSPHISAVGGLWYGFSHSYIRYDGGLRLTTSDVLNPNFNTFLGILARGGSTSAVGPTELAPDAGFGVKPIPEAWPNVTLTGDASYGLTSKRALVTLGVRYTIPLK